MFIAQVLLILQPSSKQVSTRLALIDDFLTIRLLRIALNPVATAVLFLILQFPGSPPLHTKQVSLRHSALVQGSGFGSLFKVFPALILVATLMFVDLEALSHTALTWAGGPQQWVRLSVGL